MYLRFNTLYKPVENPRGIGGIDWVTRRRQQQILYLSFKLLILQTKGIQSLGTWPSLINKRSLSKLFVHPQGLSLHSMKKHCRLPIDHFGTSLELFLFAQGNVRSRQSSETFESSNRCASLAYCFQGDGYIKPDCRSDAITCFSQSTLQLHVRAIYLDGSTFFHILCKPKKKLQSW